MSIASKILYWGLHDNVLQNRPAIVRWDNDKFCIHIAVAVDYLVHDVKGIESLVSVKLMTVFYKPRQQ